MAIILPYGRPALIVADGAYAAPPDPWEHLDQPEIRGRLEPAIRAVGRIEYVGHPDLSYGGTAFVAGPDLLLTMSLGEVLDGHTFAAGRSAAVDFGLDWALGASLRVPIDEVVFVEPRWGVELVRATLPTSIAPLPLSVADPASLRDREAVLIGYPAWDVRNDPALLTQIFRGIFGLKHVLPGRVLGPAEHAYGSKDPAVLAHDCSSTGGCGGAPLVDVATGEVLGVHFGGSSLEANHAVIAQELARTPQLASSGLRLAGLPPPGPPMPSAAPLGGARDEEHSEQLAAAVSDPGGADLRTSPGDEPLVVPESRPSLRAASWREEADDQWGELLAIYERRLDLSIRAVGRVRHGGPADWSGTAFLVGDRLALTASFVVERFVEGAGTDVRIKPGVQLAIDFGNGSQPPPGVPAAAVTGVRFVHPYLQLALLELASVPEGAALLDLAAQIPSQLSGRPVALVAFSSEDGQPHLRLLPGKALQLGQLPGELPLPALVHDCDSGPGSAGGPVIDLGTGYVAGIHTHAEDLQRGFAQPSWELARDPHVWEHAVLFRPDPRPPWLGEWDIPGARPPGPAAARPGAKRSGWSVDDVPIEWSRPKPREIEGLLIAVVDIEIAWILAENVRVPIDSVEKQGAPVKVWRELLNKAAGAAKLGLLLEAIARDPQFAGIKPRLEAYL